MDTYVYDTYSYYSAAHNSCSWLDHIVVTEGLVNACNDIHVGYDFVTSDHKPMFVTLDTGAIPCTATIRPEPSVTYSVEWQKVSADDRAVYNEHTRQLLSGVPFPEVLYCTATGGNCQCHAADIGQFYDASINALTQAACPLVSRKVSVQSNAIAGWNDMVSDAHTAHRNSLREWYIHGRPRDGKAVHKRKCINQARFKYTLRACRALTEQYEADALAKANLDKDCNEFWKQVNSIGKSKPAVASCIDGKTGDENITEMWKEHYDTILNSISNTDDDEKLNDAIRNVDTSAERDSFAFNITTVNKARMNLKPRKSMGLDSISPEHLIYANDMIDTHLMLAFNAMLRHSYLPDSLLPVKIVPVVKSPSGDLSSSANYRPIAVATSPSKILELCLLECLEPLLSTNDNQFGFKPGSSTDQCIFLLKEHIRHYVNMGSPVYACFLDASKAFDRVCHSTLFLKLRDRGIPMSVVKLLIYWYKHQKMYISWNGCLSADFTVTNGVRQGGILSPALFSIYMDCLSVSLNEVFTGCYLGAQLVNHFMYADDICLISPCKDGLRDLLDRCTKVAIDLRIKFNATKSFCMRFTPKRYENIPVPEMYLSGSVIEFISSIKYLGHIIDKDLNDTLDMEKTKRNIYIRGNILVRKFGKCSDEVKTVLFRSYMISQYCAHLWMVHTKASLQSVRVAYNNVVRKFFKLHYTSSISRELVNRNLPNMDIIIRKSTYSLLQRCKSSLNKFCQSSVRDNCIFEISFGMKYVTKLYS